MLFAFNPLKKSNAMSTIHKLLTTNYKLPPFKQYRKAMGMSLLFILLPNIFFWAIAWYKGLARPLINLDYLLPLILLTAPIPYKIGKILGGLLLCVAILADFVMFAIQIFPFLDIAAIRSLLPFLLTASLRVIILVCVAAIYIFVFPFILSKASKSISFFWVFAWSIIIGLVGWSIYYEKFAHPEESRAMRFGRNNYFIAHSQIDAYFSEMGTDFIQQIKNIPPKLTPIKGEMASNREHGNNASHRFKQPYADKIMLIVAESWGMAREESVQKSILQNIYNQQDKLEFLETGFFDFAGSTVQGEMRELCKYDVANGYAFSKLPESTFAHCLPNVLKKQGYATFALHGANGQLYERTSWYPMVGFQKIMFNEDFPTLPHCDAFHGVCDSALFDVVADQFKQTANQKSFVYWMTLTSHMPYVRKDLHITRFNCQKLGLFEGDVCNNMSLEAQFFDGLGELIKRPEMKGVEVIVVGDHMPPIMDNVPFHKNLHFNDVAWLHFKVKP